MNRVDSQKIRQVRILRGLSKTAVADAVSLSRPSYSLVESGQKPLTVEQFYVLANLLSVAPQDLMTGSIVGSNYNLDYEKFKKLIMACIEFGSDLDGKITKTKLAKMVYLVDFNYFYRHGRSMTGALYRAIQRGPVADEYFRAIDQLFEEQAITIEARGSALMISAVESHLPGQLSKEELGVVRKICRKWRDRTTQEIVDFTHQQAPYLRSGAGSIIEYKHILKENERNLF